MPELPDVEVFRQYLDATSLHQRIRKVVAVDKNILWKVSPQKFRSALEGQQIRESTRHGKYVFAKLKKNSYLGLHFGMSGSLKYFKDGNEAPAHTRMLVRFQNGYHLAYISVRKLGKVFVATGIKRFIAEQQLGADALAIDSHTFQSVFQGRRGSVKTALMDQEKLAGLGNIYTDEILFQAGIRPTRKCSQLESKGWQRIFRTMRSVLNTTIKKQAQPDRFPSSFLSPHRDRGAPCPKCGNQLKQAKVGGRTTYYCPKDQV